VLHFKGIVLIYIKGKQGNGLVLGFKITATLNQTPIANTYV
jgi:hypothetical protein